MDNIKGKVSYPTGQYSIYAQTTSANSGGIVDTSSIPKYTSKQVGGSHYKDMAIEPSIFIVRNKLGWYEGNAVKYICRHKMKGGRQDLEKAIHYLELALEEMYPTQVNPVIL